MRKLLSFAAVALMLLTASCSKYRYETVKGDPLKTRIYTLDNGLTVYMNVNKETPRVQTYIAVRVGSKNDPAATTGLAHYFEHLMFKGTANFGTMNYEAEKPLLDQIEQLFEEYRATTDPEERAAIYRRIDSISYEAAQYAIPNEFQKLMAAIGATGTNAYTSYDKTVYEEDIPSNQMENWLRIEADRFKNMVIRGFHTELETIYEEKNMYLTNDNMKVYEAILSTLYPNHPYGQRTVLGSQEHLKNPSITNVKAYHKQYYVPNNIAICLSGDLDPDKTIALIDQYFGDMQPNDELPELHFPAEQPITEPVVKEIYGPEAENISLAWRIGGASTQDVDLGQLAGRILYNGMAGLIDVDLLQQQKVLSAYGFSSSLADYGMFFLNGRPKQGQTLDQVKELLLEEVAKLREGDFDEELLKAIINNYKAMIQQQYDTNDGRANMYVESFINGVAWEDEVKWLDRLTSYTKEDIVAFCNRALGEKSMAVIYKRQGTDPNEQKMSKPELTPIPANRDAVSDFLNQIQTSRVEPIEPVFLDFDKDLSKLTAQSDIPVLYKKNTTTGLFDLTYVIKTGLQTDPMLNMAFSYLEYLGTPTRSREQIQRELYNIACNYFLGAGSERGHISMRGLSENMPRVMEIIEDLVQNAQADETILQNLKNDWIKSRQDSKLSQTANFSALRRYAAYGPDYIRSVVISNEELQAVTSAELLEKVRAFFQMEHTVLYYGPESEKKLLSDLKNYHRVPQTLSEIPQKEKHEMLLTEKDRVIIAEYPAKQVYFLQYSNRGEKYDPAAEAEITLYNEYFGGGMNAIVFQEMREARSLAYSSAAFLSTPPFADRPYNFIAFIATQNDKLPDAIEAFEQIIEQMPESEASFNLAKEGTIAQLRTERIIKSSVLWTYLDAQDMGLDYDIRRSVYEQLQQMDLEDVKAAQQKWIKGRNYTYCVLGDSKDIDLNYLRQIAPLEFVSTEEIFGY